MSLTSSLHTSFAGLRNTEQKISVSSNNVTNADRAGYTRKEYAAEYGVSGLGSIPVGGSVEVQLFDPFLFEAIIEDTSLAGKVAVESDYLTRLADRLGQINGGNTLSAAMDDLATALDELSVTPEDNGLKAQAVAAAENLAYQLRQLSGSVQNMRADADREMAESVTAINNALQRIDELNEEIALANVTKRSAADLEDERNMALEKLTKEIGVDYFINSENQMRIYTDGGRPLLTSQPRTLDFTLSSSSIDSTAIYPGGLSGVTIDGVDITENISGGRLSGLINLRDNMLVQEQQKMDELANVMRDNLNTLLNTGASIPARGTVTGDADGFAAGDALTASGTMRIVTTGANGVVTDIGNFNLAGYATVNDMITDINATLGPNATASLTANGELQIVANNAGEGIAISEQTSDMGGGVGFSSFFGLNNLFTGTNAENIQVSEYLRDGNGEYLATGTLESGALAVGDTGIFAGEGSLSKSMSSGFTTLTAFGAAGNFAGQNETLDVYADKIMSSIANRANNKTEEAESVTFLLDQTKSTLQNLTGVNIDEEMTKIVDLEAQYQAAATVISTISQLFDELIAAVR